MTADALRAAPTLREALAEREAIAQWLEGQGQPGYATEVRCRPPVCGPTLEDAYAEGRKDQAEACADPLPAATIHRIKRKCAALGLDYVAFAWEVQRAAARSSGAEASGSNEHETRSAHPPEGAQTEPVVRVCKALQQLDAAFRNFVDDLDTPRPNWLRDALHDAELLLAEGALHAPSASSSAPETD